MQDVPKAAGGDRRSENFKSDSSVTFEKPKTDALRELGFSGSDDNIRKQVQRFQTMAAHPEIVAQAKAEKNGAAAARTAKTATPKQHTQTGKLYSIIAVIARKVKTNKNRREQL